MDANNWPTEYQRTTDASWVTRYKRPEEGDVHPAALATMQQQWDESHALHERITKRASEIQAEREAKEQQKREAAESIVKAREEAKRAEMEAVLQRRFLLADGTSEEWESKKAEIVAEHVKQQTLTATDDRARRVQAGLYRSF